MPDTIEETLSRTVHEQARLSRLAASSLAASSTDQRNRALGSIAVALDQHASRILEANAMDVQQARQSVESGEMSRALLNRLELNATKLRSLCSGIQQLATFPDPLNQVTLATDLDDGLTLSRVTCPIGLVGVIFESRPDALPQIVSLCVKSGNAIILKGGREAEHSNRVLVDVIRDAVAEEGISRDTIVLLESREEVAALLDADAHVDLIIPRGSNALVRHIQEHTRIPVLGHADGVCHVYVDSAGDRDKAVPIIIDSKVQYPAACNAVETLLVHIDVAPLLLPRLEEELVRLDVNIIADSRSMEYLSSANADAAKPDDWGHEFGDLVLAIKTVSTIDEAILHINRYGSRHTDSIVTDNDDAFQRFFAEVDSAGVFRNVSTRFSDGFRYGFGAEVGISTGKLHPRGPVGLDGLVTYKYKMEGNGHVAASYVGPNARPFLHRPVVR